MKITKIISILTTGGFEPKDFKICVTNLKNLLVLYFADISVANIYHPEASNTLG